MERTKKHDFDLVGISIAGARMLLVGFAGFISWWLSTNFEPVKNTMQQLAINTAGINEKLENLSDTTDKLEENQSAILLLVNSNKDEITHAKQDRADLKKLTTINHNDINDLKVRVYYLEKK
jgi:ABC-type transporter Mla subunit MlaD